MRIRALAALVAMVALAGCGGDGYPDKPQEVAKRYVASNAGSKCRYLTQRLIETLTEQKGAAARAACRHNVARVAKPKEVKLREAEVDEHEAEVEVLRDGKEAKLNLVREDGRWRISGFSD
jgi:hypothetical protein